MENLFTQHKFWSSNICWYCISEHCLKLNFIHCFCVFFLFSLWNKVVTLRYSPPRITPTTTPRTYIRPSVRSLDHHLPGSKCDDGDDRDDQDVIVMIMMWWSWSWWYVHSQLAWWLTVCETNSNGNSNSKMIRRRRSWQHPGWTVKIFQNHTFSLYSSKCFLPNHFPPSTNDPCKTSCHRTCKEPLLFKINSSGQNIHPSYHIQLMYDYNSYDIWNIIFLLD